MEGKKLCVYFEKLYMQYIGGSICSIKLPNPGIYESKEAVF